MPPKAKPGEGLKQKSLMSFFGKASASSTTSKADASRPKPQNGLVPQTPVSKPPRVRNATSSSVMSSRSSGGESSARDTPPTSDFIDVDVDMSSEDAPHQIPSSRTRLKRKLVLDESDEEMRPRLDTSDLDGEDDDEDDSMIASSFSRRLTRYKVSTKSARKSRASVSDDDDFIAPSDSEEEETKSTKSSRSSRSEYAFSDEDEEEARKPKKRSATKLKASSSVNISDGPGPAGTFLTAAERREQGKKNEKKAAEDPYSFLQDVRDKDGKRPGDKNYDPRTLYVPKSAWATFTPFEKQFWEIKQNHYDTILFFQKGKFYELYEDDARIGHQEFDLKLTSRVKMSMVGVPEMSFDFWAAKFLGKGHKVGKVSQSETALGAEMRLAADKGKSKKPKGAEEKAKDKIVQRELNKVFTNGTLVDGNLLTEDEAGHCVAIIEDQASDTSSFGICVLDCSTSQFNLSAFTDDACFTRLETIMRQLRPKEILLKKSGSGALSVGSSRLMKTIVPLNCIFTNLREVEGFTFDQTLKELCTLYPGDEEDEAILPKTVPQSIREMVYSKPAITSLGCMIWYLRQLNIDKDILSMKNFNVYDPMKRGKGLVLDGQTLAHIEVLLNNEGAEEGTLLKLLGHCITPFGKRLFRIWLCMPLLEISDIKTRQDAVEALLDNPTFEKSFADVAKGLPDLERLVSRIHANNCKVKDFLKVLQALKKLSRGMASLGDEAAEFDSKTISNLLRGAPDLVPFVEKVEAMYKRVSVDGKDVRDELVPEDGKDELYDSIMKETKDLEKYLSAQLKVFRKQLNGEQVGYWHSATGNKDIYLVETAANVKAPKDWNLGTKTKAKTRYIVPAIQKEVRQLKEAREKRTSAIASYKTRVYAAFDKDRALWLRTVRIFAELDCLLSLAKASSALGSPSCRPEFVEGDAAFVDFRDLRHPTVNVENFIPNNVQLGGQLGKIALLTGGGKSTVMRMTATGIIMAQLGMLVPAESARLCPVDAVITRMGAYDNMFSNASTFKVELDECCKILREATPRSFVILDELGRGTSTYDGMAIAAAVLHQLASHTLCLAFFATHYGTLTDEFKYHPNIRNMHMRTQVDDDLREIVFLFKLIEGVATSSFGCHVAKLASVPESVVDRADVVSKTFAHQFKERLEDKRNKDVSSRLSLYAQADFAFLYKTAAGLLAMPTDPVKQRETLQRFKAISRRHLQSH
ncbi:DNA mismatch repair protein Msh6 [Fistulina hepatica ATCC 64428]|uniref:DNA mismatch repair protein n=1 Tax=Fistulina hepatica ATCC 64428 TaxID=1128425 RepID=A0A0D7AAM3_9AGAR|nr:DNA mismatch repair protein Msh6 [Fistulina hepatica ATCC 64428]